MTYFQRFAVIFLLVIVAGEQAHAVEELFRSLAPAGGVSKWAMSPDRSRAFYYDTSRQSVYAVDTANPGVGRVLIGPVRECDDCSIDGVREFLVAADGRYLVALYGLDDIYCVAADGSSPAKLLAKARATVLLSAANPQWLLYQYAKQIWKVRYDGASPPQPLGELGPFRIDDRGRFVYINENGSLRKVDVDSDLPDEIIAEGVSDHWLEPATNVLVYKTTDAARKQHFWLARPQGDSAPVEIDPANSDALMDYDSLAISPDATSIAISYRSTFAVYSMTSPETPSYVHALNGTVGESSLPAYSPDGHWLLFADCKYMYVRDQRTGAITAEIPFEIHTFRPPTRTPVFSPFGDSVALYSGYLSVLAVISLDATGPAQIQLKPHDFSAFAFLPDGEHIVYADDYRLWRAKLDGSPPIMVQEEVDSDDPPPYYADDFSRVYYKESCCGDKVRLYSVPTTGGTVVQVSDIPQMVTGKIDILGMAEDVCYFTANDGTTNSGAFFSLVDRAVKRVDHWAYRYLSDPQFRGADCYYLNNFDINSGATQVFKSAKGEPGALRIETPSFMAQIAVPTSQDGVYSISMPGPETLVIYHSLDGIDRTLLTFEAQRDDLPAYMFPGLDDSSVLLYVRPTKTYYLLRPTGATKLPGQPIGASLDKKSILYAHTQQVSDAKAIMTVTSTPLSGSGGEMLRLGPIETNAGDDAAYYATSNELLIRGEAGSRLLPLDGGAGIDVPGRAGWYNVGKHYLLFEGGPCGEVWHSLGLFRLGEGGGPVCLEMPAGPMPEASEIAQTEDGVYVAYAVRLDSKTRYLYSVETTAPFTNRLLYTCDATHDIQVFQISPDNKSIVFDVSSDSDVNRVIYTARLDGSGITARSHPVQFARLIAWNKDGILFQGSYEAPTYDRIFLTSTEDLVDDVEGEGEGEGEGEPETAYASADVNRDLRIDLGEVLRVVQLYNAGEFHCEAGSEDGYGLGGGDRACAAHTSDYAPRDWRIGLSELLRAVQLYRNGGYVACVDAGSEDGFCLAP